MFVTLQLFLSGVQIVEVCMANQHKTGGLMELGEIRQKLVRARGRSQHHQEISVDDLLRATKKLKILGIYPTKVSNQNHHFHIFNIQVRALQLFL